MKSKAEEIIESMKDVFKLATSEFDAFFKSANNKSNGNYSTSASSGDSSTSASSGYSSTSASSGDSSTSASSGNSSKSASSGNYSQSASIGNYSQSASNGSFSKSASNGSFSKSASSGKNSASSALGYRAAVRGALGNLLMCSEYKEINNQYIPVGGKADLVDGEILKPNCWYIVEDSKWVEVDFSDNVFSYVLSTKGNVKKVRLDNKEIAYVVSDNDGNSAHGKTIKEAREELIYKKTVNFDGQIPESATGEEWIGIYRSLTGACGFGIKAFIEVNKIDLSKSYKAKEVLERIKGQFGEDKFREKIREMYGKN